MDYDGGGNSGQAEMEFSGGAVDNNGEIGGNFSASDYEEDPFE